MTTHSETLEALIELQEVDREIYTLRTERSQKPEALKAHKMELAAVEKRLEGGRNELEAHESRRRLLDGEINDAEALIAKYTGRLNQVKTNKEYQALLHDIETEKSNRRQTEEKVLETMERIEEVKKALNELEEEAKRKRERLEDEENEVNSLVAEIDEELEDLEGQRKELLGPVPAKVLKTYERLLGSTRGQALAIVEGQTCTGCYTHLPLNVVNRIHVGEEFVTCSSCNRILYIRG